MPVAEVTLPHCCVSRRDAQAKEADWLLVSPTGTLMTDMKLWTGKGLTSTTLVTDGNWHRAAFVWDGSQRILYVDDIETARDTVAGLTGSFTGLHIGVGSNLATGSFWSGLIDDVRIYSRAVKP
jgi:hypothetical protein